MLPDFSNIRVKFDPFPEREIVGEVKEVSTEASLTTRTFPVVLIMDQPEDIKILPGMAGQATADYVPEEGTSNIVIPVASTITEDLGSKAVLEGQPDAASAPADRPSYAWVIDEETMTVERREVTVGALRAAGITIEDGLKSGEWVVTAGATYLEPGQRVRIREERGG